MSDYISAELAATCDALGFYDGVTYHLDQDAFNVIKDLIKYLRRDDDTHTVRRYLGQTKLLENDLLQIAIHHADHEEMWDVLLRLMINLTSPALMVYNEEIPKEKTSRNLYLQLIGYLQSYKTALTDDRLWKVASTRLGKILNMEPGERGEENGLIIERILTLIRNVLQVPPDDNEKRKNTEATVHDEVLFALHTSRIVDLLLFMSSNSTEQQYHMQILEIIALMLREQNPMKLAMTGMERTEAEKKLEETKLLAMRRQEITDKIEKIKKYSGSRHSRFGGTFVVENMKAIGDCQMICHKPVQKVEALDFTGNKGKLKKAKNKILVEAKLEERTSALSVRLFLREFCVEFLNASYNAVMKYAKYCIVGGNHAAPLDVSHFFWTLRFFMEFNRYYKFQVKYVCETMGTEIFHLTQRQMEQYYELLVTDKKKGAFWARRLHVALKAYQELLHTLIAMDKDIDSGVRESSKVIKSNVFYVPEYRETILSQLVSYDGLKMSRDYLVDLTSTAHIFLKMLEQFCRTGRGLIVRKIKHKRRKNAKSKKKSAKENPKVVKSLEERWDDTAPELSAVMQDGVIPDVIPFDATLDIPIDEQKIIAMKKIQKLLRTKEFEEAIGLIRSARQVWPENDCFGNSDMPVEEEFLALREIFLADLGVVEDNEEKEENVENFLNNENDHDREIDDDDEENEEMEEPQYEETSFNYDDFLRRFVNVKIVKAMADLLRNFDNNTVEVNHIVVKMLHRIAWDCKMPAMIFQASIFRTFQRIFESQRPEHKELKKFGTFIIRQFAETAKKNRKAYMELLFWKNTHQAIEMVEGYDTEVENKKVSRACWTETEEDELRTLFMEHQTNKHSQDVVDWILENLIRSDRTRRGVIKKLKELHLMINSQRAAGGQKRPPEEWSEEEIEQLTELWEIHKNDIDPVDLIHVGLRIKRTKLKIKEKLLELGLAKDKKELHKKRKKKSDGSQKSSFETRSSSDESGNSEDSDSETSDTASKNHQKKRSIQKKNDKTQNKGKKEAAIVFSDSQLCVLMREVVREEMSEALEWLKESLEEALDDRDEESSEGIPLVPLSDNSSMAMESPSFRRLLRAIGIDAPADEQEAYWRIPATMLPATIRKRCELIIKTLAGNSTDQGTLEIAESKSDNDQSESDDDDDDGQSDLNNIKKLFNNNNGLSQNEKLNSTAQSRQRAGGSDTSSDEDTLQTKTRIKKSVETKLTREIKSMENNHENKSEKLKLNKSRLRVMQDSSSDSEMDIDNSNEINNVESKRHRSDNSDTETPSTKKRRVIQINSDDDDGDDNASNDEENNSTNVKQSRRIISDDEDD